MAIEEIGKQIENKDKEYNSLRKQCDDITRKMRKTMDEKYKLEEQMNDAIIKELSIAPNQYFVLQETGDFHYDIFQILKIKSIKNRTVKCENIRYRSDDGELSLTSKPISYSMKALLTYLVGNKFERISEEEALRLIKIGLECEIREILHVQTEGIIAGKIPYGLDNRKTVYTA